MIKDDAAELWEVIDDLKSHLFEVQQLLPPASELFRQLDQAIAAATRHSDINGSNQVPVVDLLSWFAAHGVSRPTSTDRRKQRPFPLLHSPRRFRLPRLNAPTCASLAPPSERKGTHSAIARVSKATRPLLPFSS